MFNIKLIFGIVSLILAIVCFFPYIRDILSKKTKPHIYSWLIWCILQFIGVVAIITDGGSWGALSLGVGLFSCILIFFLSFKYGTKNITKFDTVCLIAAIFAIAFWLLEKNTAFSVTFVTIIDFVGFLPTYRKSYCDPNSETASLYFLSSIANVFSILALTNYTLSTTLYISSLAITNMLCVIIITLRRKALTK